MWTGVAQGDLRVPAAGSPQHVKRAYDMRMSSLVDGRPVVWARQVHGHHVIVAGSSAGSSTASSTDPSPGMNEAISGDAIVTCSTDCAIAVFTADCAPVLLHAEGAGSAGGNGRTVLGVAHAGWRGLLEGVLGSTVDAMRELVGPFTTRTTALLGPCIGPECYEFGEADLAVIAERFGEQVRSHTAQGRRALDMRSAVRAALEESDIVMQSAFAPTEPACTSCQPGLWFSHRARADTGRQALIAWMEPS